MLLLFNLQLHYFILCPFTSVEIKCYRMSECIRRNTQIIQQLYSSKVLCLMPRNSKFQALPCPFAVQNFNNDFDVYNIKGT